MKLMKIKKPDYYYLEDYFQDMRNEMSNLLKNTFETFETNGMETKKEGLVHRPPVELYEKDGNYELKAQLPGVKKEAIDVEVSEDSIKIKAETKIKKEEEKENLYRSEFHYGKFVRQIPLPKDVISSEAEAEYKDGVLTVCVPKSKKEEKYLKKLTVK